MRLGFGLAACLVCACRAAPDSRVPSPIPSTPVATTGALARQMLARPSFDWHSFQLAHVRLHLAGDMTIGRVRALADSIERARDVALARLDEKNIADEPPIEVFLVETRNDMQRLVGRPVGGAGFSDELTAVLVAGAGYHSFFRHELTHSYVARRWGRRQSGSWLDEGLATAATGACQGYSVDAIAAGYINRGESPTLEALTGDFYKLPELPAYFTAASLTDFLKRSDGAGALRSIWRGEWAGTDGSHPLGPETSQLWSDWRRHLGSIPPATLDTVRLRSDGC